MESATCIQIGSGYKTASVKEWKCSDCEQTFVYVGAPNYCPECGIEFDHIDVPK